MATPFRSSAGGTGGIPGSSGTSGGMSPRTRAATASSRRSTISRSKTARKPLIVPPPRP